MTWCAAMFFHWRPDGSLLASCPTFPEWRFVAAIDDKVSRAAAETSLREWVYRELRVSKYEIPQANEQFARAA